jgi:hypothetical protein
LNLGQTPPQLGKQDAMSTANGYNVPMKSPTTQTRLANLIKSDVDAGRKVQSLEIDQKDRASLIEEIIKGKGPLAKTIKKSGIDVALPSLNGVPLRWGAAETRTQMKK